MLKKIFFVLIVLLSINSFAQVKNIIDKYNLPDVISETSGLIFINGKLVTHNDSGDTARLFEIDTISGTISRTITLTNATNIDWEDITHDDTYIYIGDIGNNNGNRQDLKIYRILKSDFNSKTEISSKTITYTYTDQVDFSINPLNHNFDAESISAYNDKLIIFSKNWRDNTVNAYSIPKTIGNHFATKIGSYNSEGLITGSTYNKDDNSFLLSGYTKTGNPFLVYLANVDIQNIFSGSIEKTDLTSLIGQGSQIEGISVINEDNYFLSREKVTTVFNGNLIVLPQKLYRLDNGSFKPLSIDHFIRNSVLIYPNPTDEQVHIKGIKIKQWKIINSNGKTVLEQKNSNNKIRVKELTTGIYFIKIISENNIIFIKKFVKN